MSSMDLVTPPYPFSTMVSPTYLITKTKPYQDHGPSSNYNEDLSPELKSCWSEKFAPMFDGFRFIETLLFHYFNWCNLDDIMWVIICLGKRKIGGFSSGKLRKMIIFAHWKRLYSTMLKKDPYFFQAFNLMPLLCKRSLSYLLFVFKDLHNNKFIGPFPPQIRYVKSIISANSFLTSSKKLLRPPGNEKPQWKPLFSPCWDATGASLWKLVKASKKAKKKKKKDFAALQGST
ncbi:unnamed protein product [Lactuca saligna]|uniref:Uncharacterized protein n=1 Tax=Lactuca saligna TaxID=75948 RepID=A0AA35ZVU0_LACSI|nr:unnamed protein product [Lactuca saligna]